MRFCSRKVGLPVFIMFVILLTGCLHSQEEVNRDETEQKNEEEQLQEKKSVSMDIHIPRWLEADHTPVFDNQGLRYRDYSNVMHAISIAGGISRDSEMGHDHYRPELAQEVMAQQARLWLDLLGEVKESFLLEGSLIPYVMETKEGWKVQGEPDLADYSHGVYAYHMHHRAERWEEHGLFESIIHEPTDYITSFGRFLLDSRYEDGKFYHDSRLQSFDTESMSHGLAGIHGHAYAWVRWAKPGGADDMGRLDKSQLAGWLGYDPKDLVQVAREVKEVLDESWDEDLAIYDFGDGTEYSLDTLGSLIRGQKALYEILYVYGDEQGKEEGRVLFERTASILDGVLESGEVMKPWGIPSHIDFTEEGVKVASDTVDTEQLWEFVNHVSGGFAFTREREGTSMFLNEHRPDLQTSLGSLTDQMLKGALHYQLEDDYLASELDFETGDITDSRRSASAIGLFVTAAGNAYQLGDAFEQASDWEEHDSEVVERSRQLYDVIVQHAELLENEFVIRE
ncbi:hypothetical protein [Bacillus sp. FJAT-44742]|uniref:hypothetical protein n=1 Tax=Bacillus sp. FJAT-44742 TaxID=2014005 RepID=UPI000C239276|nr:hypothetical protein [Bacillus sp. FJAT-44742]